MLNAISAGRDRRWCGSSSKQSAPAPTSLQRGYGTKRQPEGPKDNRRARDLPGRNVPDGSLADVRQSPSYVRFTPESGHRHRWHLRVHALTTVPRYGRRARNTTARC
jgi:hypothetical protein